MKNAFSILIILLYPLKEEAFAQTKNNLSNLTVEEAFRPKMPTRMDTLNFPFYNGMQMIEVDHIGFWDKKIYFLEQSQPRAMPHSMFNPMPIGNEFFFRDTSGTIVKAFNTKHSLSALTKHFKNVPIRKKSNSFWGSGLFRRKSMEKIFHPFNLKDAWDVFFLLRRINCGI